MQIASYTGTRPGVQGIANRVIRWRFNGRHSHNEIVFQEHDGVDHLMPDGTCAPDADGALWCASSVAWEILPAWSRYRAGGRGGVRFKRIVLDAERWDVAPTTRDATRAATWVSVHEGEPYSWRLIARFVSWLVEISSKAKQWVCSQAVGEMLAYPDAWRLDPCMLAIIAREEADGHA